MKKEALELVRKLFHDLKWEIPHNNLEDIFNGAKSAAKIFAKQMAEDVKTSGLETIAMRSSWSDCATKPFSEAKVESKMK